MIKEREWEEFKYKVMEEKGGGGEKIEKKFLTRGKEN
jgi:hypothetical protein